MGKYLYCVFHIRGSAEEFESSQESCPRCLFTVFDDVHDYCGYLCTKVNTYREHVIPADCQ